MAGGTGTQRQLNHSNSFRSDRSSKLQQKAPQLKKQISTVVKPKAVPKKLQPIDQSSLS